MGVGIVEVGLMRVADDAYGQGAGGKDYLLGNIGAQPADDLAAAALVLQDLSGLGKGFVQLPESIEYAQFIASPYIDLICLSGAGDLSPAGGPGGVPQFFYLPPRVGARGLTND
jgi:hypothetical protein